MRNTAGATRRIAACVALAVAGCAPVATPDSPGLLGTWVKRVAPVLVWLPLAAACGILGPRDAQRDALEANRARWAARGPSFYVYALRRSCFCPYLGPVRVTVAADTVAARVYVESGEPVPEVEAEAFPTVDGLFELLERAFEYGADDIDVTYDPDLGVPVDISIDYLENADDDELGIQVTEPVEALPVALASTS